METEKKNETSMEIVRRTENEESTFDSVLIPPRTWNGDTCPLPESETARQAGRQAA